MSKQKFDKTSLETARENLSTLFNEFSADTSIPVANVSDIVADDRAFVYRMKRSGLSFAMYDRVVGRFSALWPAGLDWPAAVPRPKPEETPPKARAKLKERQEIAARKTIPHQPVTEARNG